MVVTDGVIDDGVVDMLLVVAVLVGSGNGHAGVGLRCTINSKHSETHCIQFITHGLKH